MDDGNETGRDTRIELMKGQIDQGRLNIDKIRQEMRWEVYKALAAILGAAVAIVGTAVGLGVWFSHWH
jgi:hypothetical protein